MSDKGSSSDDIPENNDINEVVSQKKRPKRNDKNKGRHDNRASSPINIPRRNPVDSGQQGDEEGTENQNDNENENENERNKKPSRSPPKGVSKKVNITSSLSDHTHLEERETSDLTSNAPNMVQCEIQEEVIMNMVEAVINKKMDTIRMMVESCVNKKLKDYRKLANNQNKAHTGGQGGQAAYGISRLPGIRNYQDNHCVHVNQETQGIQGNQGNQETQAIQGIQGIQGSQGSQLCQRTLGTPCTPCTPGSLCTPGTLGTLGTPGTEGTHGTQEIQGTHLYNQTIFPAVQIDNPGDFNTVNAFTTFNTVNALDTATASASVNPYSSEGGSVIPSPLLNFGTENFQYMHMPYLSDVIKNLNDFKQVFHVVLKDLYFNPDHKENNVVYIPPNAYKTMSIFVDGIWKNYDLDISLQNIIRRVNDVLQYYLVGNSEEDIFRSEIGKRKFDQLHVFTNQVDNMEEYPDFLIGLMQQAEHTIVTHQHLVHRNLTECDVMQPRE